MTEMTLQPQDNVGGAVLHMALELSKAKWKIGFECGRRRRRKVVGGGDVLALREEIQRAKAKFGLAEDAPVISCYEAGGDGFWLHRLLESWGVANRVVDPASIEVSRQARRAKTDALDLEMLLTKLRQHEQGERVWRVVHVPSPEAEAGRCLHRERERLKKERAGLVNRLKGTLFAQGIRLERIVLKDWPEQVARFRHVSGAPLAADLRGELLRAGERLALVERHLRALEAEQEKRVRELPAQAEGPLAMVRQLRGLKGIEPVAAWVFVMEFFGWRRFRNAKQVGALAGLTGTPYDSGESPREQGISKQGNRRVRALAVEIAWLWLRHQPDSCLSRWFHARFGATTGKRHRRVGIVALARKLLVALWRYLDTGLLPEGAALKAGAA